MVTIWFDGLCEPNSGDPNATATFGFVIRRDADPLNPVYGCGQLSMPNPTNNVAEYVALGKALRLLSGSGWPVGELHILGDSQLVIEQFNGNWKCEAANLKSLLAGCREIVASLKLPPEKVRAQWIPRAQNVEADNLSRAAFVGYVGKFVPERPEKAQHKSPAGGAG